MNKTDFKGSKIKNMFALMPRAAIYKALIGVCVFGSIALVIFNDNIGSVECQLSDQSTPNSIKALASQCAQVTTRKDFSSNIDKILEQYDSPNTAIAEVSREKIQSEFWKGLHETPSFFGFKDGHIRLFMLVLIVSLVVSGIVCYFELHSLKENEFDCDSYLPENRDVATLEEIYRKS